MMSVKRDREFSTFLPFPLSLSYSVLFESCCDIGFLCLFEDLLVVVEGGSCFLSSLCHDVWLFFFLVALLFSCSQVCLDMMIKWDHRGRLRGRKTETERKRRDQEMRGSSSVFPSVTKYLFRERRRERESGMKY